MTERHPARQPLLDHRRPSAKGVGGPLGLPFQRRQRGRRLAGWQRARGGALRLHDVGQLMGQQTQTTARMRRVEALVEGDVAAQRVGRGAELPRGVGRPCLGVQPHVGEATAELGLEQSPRTRRQGEPDPAHPVLGPGEPVRTNRRRTAFLTNPHPVCR